MFGRCGKIFLCCLLAVLAIEGLALQLSRRDKSTRIYGGEFVNISERPYLVQLRVTRNGELLCGGTLVDSTHVITAAHCFGDLYEADVEVVGGANTLAETGVKRRIKKEYYHPRFRRNGDNDVSVLKLESPMEGKNIQPIAISYEDVPDGKFLTISGWGYTGNAEWRSTDFARTTRVEKIPNDVCNKTLVDYEGISSSMICAFTPDKDSCIGDSGGPAIYHGKLVALVSWGPSNCTKTEFPGVYTSLKSVKDFIEKSLKK